MIIKKTKSLCPICLKVLDAEVYNNSGNVMMRKECPEHGIFENTYWTNENIYNQAESCDYKGNGLTNPQTSNEKGCPLDCGICSEHESHTVLGLIDITNRCNLKCPICFANAAVSKKIYEPTFEEIREMLINLLKIQPVSTPAIQYAGGEPTVRKDIVELIQLAHDEGFTHIQIATNGVKLAKDPNLAQKLRNAELNTVYLQFDGVTPDVYIKNRGRDLLDIKKEAINNCRKADLGVVLVPTLIKGINDHQVGDIINFAIENIDIIRGVNFQPISFSGRTPADQVEEQRVTIPDFEKLVTEQLNNDIKIEDFYPASCIRPISDLVEILEGEPQVTFTCHQHCGTATYLFIDGDKRIPINRFIDVDRFFEVIEESTAKLRGAKFAKKTLTLAKATKELTKTVNMNNVPSNLDIKQILATVFKERSYDALADFHYNALLIGCMHFMDPFNFDADRSKRCVIHYALPDGRIIPFCTMNSLYREEIEAKYSKPMNK